MRETFYRISGSPRLALLSDFHNTEPDVVISSLSLRRPEIICVTGDVLYGSRPLDNTSPLETQKNVLPFLSACSSLAPTFLSLGNHEWMLDRADITLLSSTGVTVLDNNWVKQDGLVIGGLTSGYVTDYRQFRVSVNDGSRYPSREDLCGVGGAVTAKEHKPDAEWLPAFSAAEGFHVLLSHHPEYYPLVPERVELILCGHAHGGQWRLFGHGVLTPGQGLWPKYSKGVYDGRLVVSAGLSNTTWAPRLFNPVEAIFLNM